MEQSISRLKASTITTGPHWKHSDFQRTILLLPCRRPTPYRRRVSVVETNRVGSCDSPAYRKRPNCSPVWILLFLLPDRTPKHFVYPRSFPMWAKDWRDKNRPVAHNGLDCEPRRREIREDLERTNAIDNLRWRVPKWVEPIDFNCPEAWNSHGAGKFILLVVVAGKFLSTHINDISFTDVVIKSDRWETRYLGSVREVGDLVFPMKDTPK